eukprot:jgi/Ulvmu1/959/UM102_0042.1
MQPSQGGPPLYAAQADRAPPAPVMHDRAVPAAHDRAVPAVRPVSSAQCVQPVSCEAVGHYAQQPPATLWPPGSAAPPFPSSASEDVLCHVLPQRASHQLHVQACCLGPQHAQHAVAAQQQPRAVSRWPDATAVRHAAVEERPGGSGDHMYAGALSSGSEPGASAVGGGWGPAMYGGLDDGHGTMKSHAFMPQTCWGPAAHAVSMPQKLQNHSMRAHPPALS